MNILLSIDSSDVKDLDSLAKESGLPRASYIRLVLKNHLSKGVVPVANMGRLERAVVEKKIETCKHGAALGLCKMGC